MERRGNSTPPAVPTGGIEALKDRLSLSLAGTKVRRPTDHGPSRDPLPAEIAVEKRRLDPGGRRPFGFLYDGYDLMQIAASLLPMEESSRAHLHIIFTNQLLGTREEGEDRYHARVCVLGSPSLISTSGMVEAPAKPREFYILKRSLEALGMGETAEVEFAREAGARFLDHDDPRMEEAACGYALQAVFHWIGAEGFCGDQGCRLFNAHWQRELLAAQVRGPVPGVGLAPEAGVMPEPGSEPGSEPGPEPRFEPGSEPTLPTDVPLPAIGLCRCHLEQLKRWKESAPITFRL
ncbi:MAG: hypothetical protein HYY09_03240 [Firmicutes bacterium]|nr:hypothetical protein [Bacillota bacterium]